MASGNFCLHSVRTFNSWFSKRFISLHAHQRVHSRLQIPTWEEVRIPGESNPFFFNEKLRSSFVCVFSDSLSRTESFLPARMPILKRFENRSEIIIARCLTKGFWRSRGSVRKTLLGCPHPLCICITIQPLLCIIILKCSINEGQLPEGTMPLGLSSKIQNGSGEIKRYWEVLLRAPRGREKANPCWIFRNSIMMTTKKRKIVCEIYM